MATVTATGYVPKGTVFSIAFYTFILGALTFVVSLAWNDAFQATINRFVKVKNAFWFRWLYALFLTILSVILVFYLAKFLHQDIRFK